MIFSALIQVLVQVYSLRVSGGVGDDDSQRANVVVSGSEGQAIGSRKQSVESRLLPLGGGRGAEKPKWGQKREHRVVQAFCT